MDGVFDEYASLIHPSALANGTIWADPFDTGWCIALPSSNHAADVAALRKWIESRVKWLDKRVASGNL